MADRLYLSVWFPSFHEQLVGGFLKLRAKGSELDGWRLQATGKRRETSLPWPLWNLRLSRR